MNVVTVQQVFLFLFLPLVIMKAEEGNRYSYSGFTCSFSKLSFFIVGRKRKRRRKTTAERLSNEFFI